MPTLPAAGYNTPDFPTVTPSPDAGTPYQSGQAASEGAFGGLTARALSGLGESFQKAGGSFENIVVRFNDAVADEQANSYQDRVTKRRFGDPNDPSDVGFAGLNDKDKQAGFKPFLETLEKDLQEHRAKLTPAQQARFDERTRPFHQNVLTQTGHDYVTAVRKYTEQVGKDTAERNAQKVEAAAATLDPTALNAFVEQNIKDNQKRAVDEGWSPEATRKREPGCEEARRGGLRHDTGGEQSRRRRSMGHETRKPGSPRR